MEYKDYYAVLGVAKEATPDEIKQSYRRLARKYHPDVSKEENAEEKFKALQEAYEVLKDSEKRAAYDQLGEQWKEGQDFRPPPGWQSQAGHSRDFSDSDFSGYSDFFSNLFGRGRFQGQPDFQERGADQHAKIKISLEEAFHGANKILQLQVPQIDASGKIHHQLRTLKVTIPAGATSGQQLRLAQQAGSGIGGGASGDLYLEIQIEPHSLFSLEGKDVYLTLPITPWEAALGAEIQIPTLGGQVGLKLAKGAQSGQKLRLKGRGLPGKPHPGDQYALLQIRVPGAANTDEEKQLYEKMKALMSFNPRQHWPVS
jgi:curved DNA-binding protein